MTDLRLQLARDLRAIEDLFARLPAEAVARGAHRSMPGGDAMVMLGPGADTEAFGYAQLSAIFGRTDPASVEEQLGSDPEPPLSLLAGWTDIVREARGQPPSIKRATIAGEIRYLRHAIPWMVSVDGDGVPVFDPVESLADDLHKHRRALEGVLKAGDRADTGAPCLNDACGGRLLVREWADDPDKDRWVCYTCGNDYDDASYARAVEQASGIYADKLSATDMERIYRIPNKTLRKWSERGRVRRRGWDSSGRKLFDVDDAVACRDGEARDAG